MFDLEEQITNWRQQMLAAGIKTPVPLEELESHLRDAIEQQVQLGVDPQQAFHAAARQIGHANDLKSEFTKACGTNLIARSFGILPLLGTLVLNLLGLFAFHRSSSVFFSHNWWAAWFPNYVVWFAYLIIGLANPAWLRCRTKKCRE